MTADDTLMPMDQHVDAGFPLGEHFGPRSINDVVHALQCVLGRRGRQVPSGADGLLLPLPIR